MSVIFLAGMALAAATMMLPAAGGTDDCAPASRRNAEALRLVSEFTTRYSCCPPRVTNIKRAAGLIDGTTIKPGELFSMNTALQRRTRARGFVAAPQISGGRLINAVGGGISQVATTLYNAAFFAGLALVEHTPRSFYISRYPKGREATISWGGPELVFRNDWNAPLRMRIQATDSSITVRFYSRQLGRRVTSTTDTPHSYERPHTVTLVSYSLRRATSRAGSWSRRVHDQLCTQGLPRV